MLFYAESFNFRDSSAHNGMVGSPMITADPHEYPEFSKVSRNGSPDNMKEMGLKCRVFGDILYPLMSTHSYLLYNQQVVVF